MSLPTKHICTVTVMDPDSKGPVAVEIRKIEHNGAMIGIDGSYLENDVGNVLNPYITDPTELLELKDPDEVTLDIPDDELPKDVLKLFETYVVWGLTTTVAETGDILPYSFATAEELAGFLHGLEQASGWLENASFETEEEAEEYVKECKS